jgi:predicted nucleic-acid-binding protein
MVQAEMKVTADTNVLVRAVMADDKKQASAAARILERAELIAITLPCFCEFVWVLRSTYKISQKDISDALEALLNAENVAVNRPAVDAGLAMLKAGGDFADGLIAYEGAWMGGNTFVSFDKQAVALLVEQGKVAQLME